MRRPRLAGALCVLFLFACASPPRSASGGGGDYLRYVAVEVPGSERVLLRWPTRSMPLRVHLPRPPKGLFPQPDAIYDSVRDGVLDWTDVAGPGLPRFEFVDEPGAADIPIVWAAEPSGDWYIAYCYADIDPFTRRFGVAHVLVTGRGPGGRVADLHDVYAVMLHEMGHALGLAGHSPDPDDVMFPRVSGTAIEGPSPRDRATLRRLYELPRGKRVVGARRAD